MSVRTRTLLIAALLLGLVFGTSGQAAQVWKGSPKAHYAGQVAPDCADGCPAGPRPITITQW